MEAAADSSWPSLRATDRVLDLACGTGDIVVRGAYRRRGPASASTSRTGCCNSRDSGGTIRARRS